MTDIAVGRPRWTDVLHQIEITEARLLGAIAKLERMFEAHTVAVDGLESRVLKIEQEDMISARRSRDVLKLSSWSKDIMTLMIAGAAVVIAFLK